MSRFHVQRGQQTSWSIRGNLRGQQTSWRDAGPASGDLFMANKLPGGTSAPASGDLFMANKLPGGTSAPASGSLFMANKLPGGTSAPASGDLFMANKLPGGTSAPASGSLQFSPPNSHPAGASPSRAFTLVELLVVIGIIVMMMAFAVPAITSLSGSRTMGANLETLADLLEYARTEAQARNTYVWVGFKNLPTTDPANSSGNHEVAAAAFWSTDGTPGATGDTLKPLSKLFRLEGVQLVRGSWDSNDLSGEIQTLLDEGKYDTGDRAPAPTGIAGNTGGKTLPADAFKDIEFDRVLTFTPAGEALLMGEPQPTDGFDHVIDFGLKRMRGDNPDDNNPDDAALWLFGASGQIQQWRLQ